MNNPGPLAGEVVAKAMAASSAGIAGLTWITALNDVLQLFATGVAIVAGIYAIVWHRVRIEEVKKKVDTIHKEIVPGESKEGETPDEQSN